MPEWQRLAGKAAKEVEKFAKEKADIVLMHWRDKMGIAQKEVSSHFPSGLSARAIGACPRLSRSRNCSTQLHLLGAGRHCKHSGDWLRAGPGRAHWLGEEPACTLKGDLPSEQAGGRVLLWIVAASMRACISTAWGGLVLGRLAHCGAL